jgi:Fur family iron response transcriptional regulator
MKGGGRGSALPAREAGKRALAKEPVISSGSTADGKGARHLTAEMLDEEAKLAEVPVSLATIYNTLNQLTDAGLLREIRVKGTKTYFDANVTAHHHFYFEHKHELVDILDPRVVLKMPEVPEGYEISYIDMIVRPRKMS